MLKLRYGIDAPTVVRTLLVVSLLVFLLVLWLPQDNRYLSLVLQVLAIGSFVIGTLMLLYSLFGKRKHGKRIISRIAWRGDERVLDVGTGAGLLLIEAAKKLQIGQVIGIDVWSEKDLSKNTAEQTLKNAREEGVQDKIDVQNQDAQEMNFPESSFDVILSNLCLHNIPTASGRMLACREISRVLKPGGRAIISDFMKTKEYLHTLQSEGLQVKRTGPYLWDTFPPLWIVEAIKS